jgi:hypothetical protein
LTYPWRWRAKYLGFPILNDLMFELKKFTEGDGKGMHDALTKHAN